MVDELHLGKDPNSAREEAFLAGVRALLRLPSQAHLQLLSSHVDSHGGHAVEYTVTVPIRLHGPEYGVADGVTVDEQTSAQLNFDAAGKLVSSHLAPIDERHLQLVQDQVKKLAAADQIAPVPPNRGSGSKDKPWFLERDPQGVSRLKRAHMS